MEIGWKSSHSASCLHLAACFQEGLPVADASLAEEMGGAIQHFLAECEASRLPTAELLPHLIGLSSEVGNNRQLVQRTATRLWGSQAINETIVGQLAGAISDLEAAISRTRPQLEEELAVRARPLREQWESRGPGLLRQAAGLSEDLLIAPMAEIVLVAPIVGGHGRAHLLSNRVTFEAVLTNPHPHLPETLRLGWLLSQLNLDLPIFSEHFSAQRLPLISELATIPLVLAAGERVELAQLDQQSIAATLECWHLPVDLPANTDQLLLTWWETYISGRSSWAVALTALDSMLREAMSTE